MDFWIGIRHLWTWLIAVEYGEALCAWTSEEVRGSCFVSVEEYKGRVRDSFSCIIVLRIKIGDGSEVQFW